MRKSVFFASNGTSKREEIIRQLLEKIRVADSKQVYFNNVDYVQLRGDLLESPKEFFDNFVIPLVNQCTFLTEEQLSLLAPMKELDLEDSILEKQVSDQKQQIKVQQAMKRRLELLTNNSQRNRDNHIDLSHIEMLRGELDNFCDRLNEPVIDMDILKQQCDSIAFVGTQYQCILQEFKAQLALLIPAAANRINLASKITNKPFQLDTSMLRNYLTLANLLFIYINGQLKTSINQQEQIIEFAKLQQNLQKIHTKVKQMFNRINENMETMFGKNVLDMTEHY